MFVVMSQAMTSIMSQAMTNIMSRAMTSIMLNKFYSNSYSFWVNPLAFLCYNDRFEYIIPIYTLINEYHPHVALQRCISVSDV